MTTLNIETLKNQFANKAYDNQFFVDAADVLSRALDSAWDSKSELSDFVNEKLDSDNYNNLDQDIFIDSTNDIIAVVSEFYNLD